MNAVQALSSPSGLFLKTSPNPSLSILLIPEIPLFSEQYFHSILQNIDHSHAQVFYPDLGSRKEEGGKEEHDVLSPSEYQEGIDCSCSFLKNQQECPILCISAGYGATVALHYAASKVFVTLLLFTSFCFCRLPLFTQS